MIKIKPLKYDFNALAPVTGSDTLFFHHDKHYAGYVNKTNEMITSQGKTGDLQNIIAEAREQRDVALFNQAAQVWNHEFFFDGLSLNEEDRKISASLLRLIDSTFKSVDTLQTELIQAATTLFGSGWVWLVMEEGKLKIQKTSNAETPCGLEGIKPLWCLDVWEHAYYLDYQNRRADYAAEIVKKAMNWRIVSDRLGL